MYEHDKPSYGKIPTLVYDPECSLDIPLDRGSGSIIMIKTLLSHIHTKIPEVRIFKFEDKSTIECGTEDEKHQKRKRKRGTHAYPAPLYYMSILFNGCTWYEKHFNATHEDKAIHATYRAKVKEILYDSTKKVTFPEFLQIAGPSDTIIKELESYYTKTDTYHSFVNSIPKQDRCRVVRGWISTFMEHYFKDVFFQDKWIIDITTMPNNIKAANIAKAANQAGDTKKKRKKIVYYCPKGKLYYDSYDMGGTL